MTTPAPDPPQRTLTLELEAILGMPIEDIARYLHDAWAAPTTTHTPESPNQPSSTPKETHHD